MSEECHELLALPLPSVDLKYVESLLGNKPKMLCELLGELCVDVEEFRLDLTWERVEVNRRVAQRRIHRLKGSSANLGVKDMKTSLREMEVFLENLPDNPSDEALSTWAALVSSFEHQFALLQESLKQCS